MAAFALGEALMIYLNNAASSYPKPPGVAKAVCEALEQPPFSGARGAAVRTGSDAETAPAGGEGPAGECRALLGGLFGADAARFFFTGGATEAFNLVVRGLAPRRVVVTAADHNAVLRPLYALLPQDAICVAPCGADGLLLPGALAEAAASGADALFVNHCSNVTGAVQNLAEAAGVAKRAGAVLVVDAAQSAGVVPLDVEKAGIDILVFTGHKGLFGPAGTGGFYLREGMPLAAAKFGGTGTEGDAVRPAAKELFEVGTQNAPGLAGLAAGLRYVQSEGVAALGRRVNALAEKIVKGLAGIRGVGVYAPAAGPRGGAVGFTLGGLSPADAAYILRHSYGIELRAGHQCAPLYMQAAGLPGGLLRASVSALTPEEDVNALLCAVAEISEGVGA